MARNQSGTYVPIGDEGVHEGEVDHRPGSESYPTPGPLDDIKNGIKVWADIGATIGQSVDKMAAAQERTWRALQKNTPIYYQEQAAAVAATGVATLLNLGSPDQGTRWEVTTVTIAGVDYNVAAVGSAGLYIAGNTLARGVINLVDFAPGLPNQATYGHDQVVVNDQEFLFVYVDGGTNGQTYAAVASVTVWPTSAGGGRAEIAV